MVSNMDTSTILLLCAVGVLLILTLFFLVRYLRMRAELRSFREQINEIRTTDREQPIKVASFGAPTVDLAKEINLLVKELREAVNRSEEEERRVRIIMAGVSHDFRTPLTAADGYLQMVDEILKRYPEAQAADRNYAGDTADHGSPSGTGDDHGVIAEPGVDRGTPAGAGVDHGSSVGNRELPPEALNDLKEIRDYLTIVSERVRYLRSLSDEFFEVTYLDARKKIPLEKVRLDTVLSEVILGQYQWIEKEQIETRFQIPEEKMEILADKHYLERILENLFSNARKYTKSFLAVEITENGDAGDGNPGSGEFGKAVIFTIRNDIREYTEMDTAHIFEPFYRAKGRTGQGTGLGLYVCKELAEAMHFTIEGNVTGGVFELKLSMPKAEASGKAGKYVWRVQSD